VGVDSPAVRTERGQAEREQAEGATQEPRARVVLGLAYVTNFGALAASSPFLALHLGAIGFSPQATARLLGALLLLPLVATPGFTLLADRARAIGGVLRLTILAGLAAFTLLFVEQRHLVVAVALAFFAAFRAPFAALLDALTLREVPASFGAVRSWGTAGYALSALMTGASVAYFGSRAILYFTTGLLVCSFAAAWAIPKEPPPPPRNDAARAGESRHFVALVGVLLRRPRVLLLFGVALLQEMGLAPYDALFAAYLTKVGGAMAAGIAVPLGAGAEFVFLLTGGPLVRRLGPERLLLLSCVASSVRWGLIAVVTNPVALVVIQVFHSLSFGAFYMAAVMLMDRETPPALRASGQGIFGSFSFGVCAALAMWIAGLVEPRAGMQGVFALASITSLVAALGASFLRPPNPAEAGGALSRAID
jgi:PPP family 3-phenylpropionic acid transporter